MKKTLTALLSLFSIALVTSCNPDDIEKADEIKDITLAASSEITVTEQNAAQNLLEVSWTDISIYQSEVSYTVVFALEGGNSSQVLEATSAASPLKYTGAAVQALLVGDWGLAADAEHTVTVKVNAVKAGKVVNSSQESRI